jgi:hypothetical protein
MKTKQLKQSEALERIERRIIFWQKVEACNNEEQILEYSAQDYNDWKCLFFVKKQVFTLGKSVLAAHHLLATGKLKTLNRDAANLRKKLGWN